MTIDRFVDVPEENVPNVNTVPKRKNQDKHVTMFGTKLLTLRKRKLL